MAEKKYYPVEELRAFCMKLLQQVIPQEEDCRAIVDSLIEANLRGVDSHGLVRTLTYYNRFKTIEWQNPEIIRENMTTALIDGHNAPGQICGLKAMRMAIAKAGECGVGMVGVKNSNHFGTAAYYTNLAAEKGMIGFAFSNASPRIPPWGGREGILGNNPWSFAFPTDRGFNVIQDFSNSVVAAGKIRAAAAKGEPIPLGWAMDKEGNPTQDAQLALKGLFMPIAEHKGYSIIMVVDILSAVLTGSAYGPHTKGIDNTDVPQKIGHFFGAFKVDNFMTLAEFYQRMNDYIDTIKNSKKADGVGEIFVPGEIEHRCFLERKDKGIPLSEDAIKRLNQVAAELGMAGI